MTSCLGSWHWNELVWYFFISNLVPLLFLPFFFFLSWLSPFIGSLGNKTFVFLNSIPSNSKMPLGKLWLTVLHSNVELSNYCSLTKNFQRTGLCCFWLLCVWRVLLCSICMFMLHRDVCRARCTHTKNAWVKK